MQTLNESITRWDGSYRWPKAGDEWSAAWGSTDAEWRWTILPRLYPYLRPEARIVEIAPGFGRWTQYLLRDARSLDAVDVLNECVEACRERFRADPRARFYKGSGNSLEMISNDSTDLVFSFDSLVHVDFDVLRAYFREIARVLTNEGVGFIHHSVAGKYRRHFAWWREGSGRRIRSAMSRLTFGAIDRTSHLRAQDVTRKNSLRAAREAGLNVISQECFPWHTRRIIDAITVVTKADVERTTFVDSVDFMNEARTAARRSSLPDR